VLTLVWGLSKEVAGNLEFGYSALVLGGTKAMNALDP